APSFAAPTRAPARPHMTPKSGSQTHTGWSGVQQALVPPPQQTEYGSGQQLCSQQYGSLGGQHWFQPTAWGQVWPTHIWQVPLTQRAPGMADVQVARSGRGPE